jgi:biopolymer transport protein TolR
MGMGGGSARGAVKADINVTPLVDVCLVLLIIFMVITPMLQRGKEVTLPKSKETDKGMKTDPMIMSVTKDKKMWLDPTGGSNSREYDEKGLQRALEEEFVKTPGRKILLKGDSSLEVGEVRKAMRVAQLAKAKGVQLGVEELK